MQKTDQRNNATKVQLDEHTRIFIGMAYKSLGEELLQEHVWHGGSWSTSKPTLAGFHFLTAASLNLSPKAADCLIRLSSVSSRPYTAYLTWKGAEHCVCFRNFLKLVLGTHWSFHVLFTSWVLTRPSPRMESFDSEDIAVQERISHATLSLPDRHAGHGEKGLLSLYGSCSAQNFFPQTMHGVFWMLWGRRKTRWCSFGRVTN